MMVDLLGHRWIDMEDVDRIRMSLLQARRVGVVAVRIEAMQAHLDQRSRQSGGIAGLGHAPHGLTDAQRGAKPADQIHPGRSDPLLQEAVQGRVPFEVKDHLVVADDANKP